MARRWLCSVPFLLCFLCATEWKHRWPSGAVRKQRSLENSRGGWYALSMHRLCIAHASSMHRTCIAHASILEALQQRWWKPSGWRLVRGLRVMWHLCMLWGLLHTGPRELNSLNSLYYLLLLTSIFFSLRPDLTLKMKSNIFLILEAILLTEHLSWEWNFHSYELPVHNNLRDIC